MMIHLLKNPVKGGNPAMESIGMNNINFIERDLFKIKIWFKLVILNKLKIEIIDIVIKQYKEK